MRLRILNSCDFASFVSFKIKRLEGSGKLKNLLRHVLLHPVPKLLGLRQIEESVTVVYPLEKSPVNLPVLSG